MRILILALLMMAGPLVSAQVTDTLGWHRFHEGTPSLYLSPNGGYAFGNNGYGDKVKAQSYSHSESFVLRGALIQFGAVTATSGNPESKVRVTVYDNNGSGLGLFGIVEGLAPDSVLAVKDILVSDLPTDGSLFDVDLSDSNLVFFNRFSIGVDVTMLASGDSVGLMSTTDGNGGQRQEAWEQESSGGWMTVVSPFSWGLDVDLAIFPLVDVNDPAGISDDPSLALRVWPNPSEGPFHVQMPFVDQWNAVVYGVNGQVIMRQSFLGDRALLDLNGAVPGLYVLQLQGRDAMLVKRIILR
jgi:hypothetical protein